MIDYNTNIIYNKLKTLSKEQLLLYKSSIFNKTSIFRVLYFFNSNFYIDCNKNSRFLTKKVL